MKITVITPEDDDESLYFDVDQRITLFLGGTINNGNSHNWQSQLITYLKEKESEIEENIAIFNPRKPIWDSQKDSIFDQATWELDHIPISDIYYCHLTNESDAPISLLELGLVLNNPGISYVSVYCHPEYSKIENIKALKLSHNIRSFKLSYDKKEAFDDIIEYINL